MGSEVQTKGPKEQVSLEDEERKKITHNLPLAETLPSIVCTCPDKFSLQEKLQVW